MVIKIETNPLDHKNRPTVTVRSASGEDVRVYRGVDATGIVSTDSGGEYVIVNGEKRYWRGIIPATKCSEVAGADDFGIIILKPDTLSRGLGEEIRRTLKHEGFQVVAETEKCLTPEEVFRLYPYFFEPDWEKHLLEYLGSDPSICLIVRRHDSIGPLLRMRDFVRMEKGRNDHPVINLLHCADSRRDAAKELGIFFGDDTERILRQAK